jgi:hypothetical protein
MYQDEFNCRRCKVYGLIYYVRTGTVKAYDYSRFPWRQRATCPLHRQRCVYGQSGGRVQCR